MFEHALPVLLALAVLAAGCLLLACRLRRPDHYAPPFARRCGRFRRGSRDELRGELYRLSARATKAGDEAAARILDRTAYELNQPADLRTVDREELERRAEADESRWRPGDYAAFRGGRLVGYLRGVELDREGAVIEFTSGARFRKGKTWQTDATDEMLAEIPSHSFRRVLALLVALGALLAPSVRAADFPTYPAAQLSQYQHRALALKPGQLVCAFGFVESVRREEDKDHHVWLCSDPALGHWTMRQRRGSCVLGEIVPSHPLPRPTKGLYVKMCGRWIPEDLEHKRTEIHEVTDWCSPAGSCEVKP